MSSPFDKQPTNYDDVFGPLINEVEKITGLSIVPNETIAKVKALPFVTYYPIAYDIPVFSDPTFNDGNFEAEISLDVFGKTLSETMSNCGKLQVYLRDPYVRQELRKQGIVIVRTNQVQTRAIDNLPFNAVHHHGFDVTIQYHRNYSSPIDRITNAYINFNH